MGRSTRWFWLVAIMIFFTIVTDASPIASKTRPRRRINLKRDLLPRTDGPFLGEDWEIVAMENNAAYLPHESAARDLEYFYTSLRMIALHPPLDLGHYFVHRINRVLITFHSRGTSIPNGLVLRFADGMLNFTRLGYTSAYRMQFRHTVYGFVITVTMTVDDVPPPAEPECVLEEHGRVNQSGGIRQVCILRPPQFPPS